jgi:hypothetical protein
VKSPQDAPTKNVPAPAKGKKKEKSEEEVAVDSLMSEIEEDLRSEELSKIWTKYGKFVVAGAFVIVLGVAGWQYWRSNLEAQRVESARQFEAASKLVQQGKIDDALTAFGAIADKKGLGYASLAQLQKAALARSKNDIPGALAAYKALAEDQNADPLFRDLARLLRGLNGLETENPLELEAFLNPLLDPSNPFTHSATELTALLAEKQGDVARALNISQGLAADLAAPAGIRQRAEEMAAVFKSMSAAAPPATAPPTPAPSAPAAK